MLAAIINFFLTNRVVTFLLLAAAVAWGIVVAPFELGVNALPRDPIAVDAIPDIGENQQIVFTRWTGRSPQDVEDQITYPLTSALLGVPGVKSVRSNSMFGFSSIYLIFDESVDFYWSRARILEKLNSLPAGVLPQGVAPSLGPDATALGQVYWYTLEGRDPSTGEPVGGWDLHELRSVQDYYVRYGLSAAEGVAEVASIGGYVREYQVDVDPEAMRVYGISLEQVMSAIQSANLDVGASTLEINLAEYFVRGLGYIKDLDDLESAVVKTTRNVPITLGQVAHINIGPAQRRGILDKAGAEAVGGVVIARFGANPLAVIDNVKARIKELAPGLPTREVDGKTSQVTIVPFYDRSTLIHETIATLEEALTLEVLITAIVVVLMLLNFRSSLLVAGLLPVAVLVSFIAMKLFGVDANVVALSGIAIAIGTMVDMGIVLTESIVTRLDTAPEDETLTESILTATNEVAGAVLTAVATTVISFLPVFTMEAAEGKLFRPLAYTKTFALVAAIVVSLLVLPALARSLWSIRRSRNPTKPENSRWKIGASVVLSLILGYLLAVEWAPMGASVSTLINFIFVVLVAGGLILAFWGVIHVYEPVLRFLLTVKWLFLIVVALIVFAGFRVYQQVGEEFMPSLGEGTFLLMPTSMPHAGAQENLINLRTLDMAVQTIPEVDLVVGKAGRADTPLDPAPMSMYENVISYKSEYRTDAEGKRIRFAYDKDTGEYTRDPANKLIPDNNGRYFRQWRDHIQTPDDIWEEIVAVAKIPGVTSAPKLQPIETRLVMLQTGMRAPMGIKVYSTDLRQIESFGMQLEEELKNVEGVKDAAVFADRIVGKPYLLIDINRQEIARYGLAITDVQRTLQAAIGGMQMTTTVEGRERYAIRIRYPRELRDDPESLKKILVSTSSGSPIPLGQLVDIRYEQGPQSIKSEDGFLVGYVLFDRLAEYSEVEVVQAATTYLDEAIASGKLVVPQGLNYRFAGNYEQQVRATKRLALVVPISLGLIFLILYLQFRSVIVALMVFSGVALAFAGGFLMIGAYDTTWFLNFSLFGTNLRDLFQVSSINLSVAVWVGFLALFGIATDDGVLVATFLRDSFRENDPETAAEIRDAVVQGGLRRVRPAMMTTATTILALLPVLSSTGRGADIMLPMAIPSFGGMVLQVLTMFTVPVLWSLWKETRLTWRKRGGLRGLLPFQRVSKVISILLLTSACWVLPKGVYAQDQLGGLTSERLDTTIQGLYTRMLAQNPALQALDLAHEAALLDGPQVSQLPDIEVGAGVFAFPVETRVGPQRVRLGATQMLPWPGKLASMEALASAKATPIIAQKAALQLEMRMRLEQAYYELASIDARQVALQETTQLYESLESTALARIEAGSGSSVDVYSIRILKSQLAEKIGVLSLSREVPLSKLTELLAQDTLLALESTSFSALLIDTFPLESVQGYLAQLNDQHPLIQVYVAQLEIRKAAADVNRLSAKPDFMVGIDYILTAERSDAAPDRNGADALIPRVGVQLPLSRKPYTARFNQLLLEEEMLQQRIREVRLRLVEEVREVAVAMKQARVRLAAIDEELELLASALAVGTSEYANGRRAFDELIRLQERDIDLRLKRITIQTTLLNARASLAKLLAL